MIAMNLSPGISVNLNLFQVFLLVAEHLSFKEAADRISRSQSAVSAQIRQLEQQLGAPLFNRTTRNVSLTPYGEILFKSARQGVNELNLGFRNVIEEINGHRGRVTMACSPTIAGTKLPALLKMFELEYAGIKVILAELPHVRMVEAIQAGDVDFGLGPVFPSSGDLNFETVMIDPLAALVPASFPIARKRSVVMSDLVDLPILLSVKTSVTRQIFEGCMKACGFTTSAKYECTQHQTQIAMVKAGLGIAILPSSVARNVQCRSVRVLKISHPGVEREVALITVRGQRLSPASSHLAALIKRRINEVPPLAY
ncbi:MAG: LysR family transcriptional regulator [Microvirga sp.]|nr:LysR family transcriptional regulator [Microvirga sp.]